MLLLAKEIYLNNLESGLYIIDALLEQIPKNEKVLFKLELLASYLCMKLFRLKEANQYLVQYEKYAVNDQACRIAIARLAKINNNKAKLVDQLDKAFEKNIELMPKDLYFDYLSGIKNDRQKTKYLLDKLAEKDIADISLFDLKINILFKENRWKDIVEAMKNSEPHSEEINDIYIHSLIKTGKLDKAISIFQNLAPRKRYTYWKLASEMAEKNKDYKTLRMCLKNQLDLTNLLS